MENELESIRGEALTEIRAASSRQELELARVKFLGRNAGISLFGERMRELPKDQRPIIGKLLNDVRVAINAAFDERQKELEAAADAEALSGIDFTLPGIRPRVGTLHPITQLQDRAVQIFRRMGFSLAEGPDIETEFHCFDALNTPPDHPARNEQDTFYLPDGRLPPTHTSTVQIRTMEKVKPPIRIIGPGAAYRRDEVDATHLSQFHQIEGLAVDRNLSVADLKGTLEFFFRELFGPDTEIRFRPHFFPFTEPSFEVDAKAKALGGGAKWLELGGCGMVDPAVFQAVNKSRGDEAFDPEEWTGFAFGCGLDRLAMILSGIPDIRMLAENDLRFLSQFP